MNQTSRHIFASLFAGAFLAACATTPVEDLVVTEVTADDLPASVLAAIAAERPDFTIEEALKKVNVWST